MSDSRSWPDLDIRPRKRRSSVAAVIATLLIGLAGSTTRSVSVESMGYDTARPTQVPNRDELDRAELTALLRLTEAGLEMRRDIRVSRTPDVVRVEASVPSPPRQHGSDALTKVEASLTKIKHVEVDFHPGPLSTTTTAVIVNTTPRTAQSLARAMTAGPGLHRWLARRLDDQQRASFVPKLARSLESVEQRLTQIAALGRAWPEASGRQLSPAGRDLFRQLIALHHRKLCRELNDLRMRLAALIAIETPTVVMSPTDPPVDLATRAPIALTHADTLERLVIELFSHDDLAEPDEQRVQAAFVTLTASLHGERAAKPMR